MNNRIANKHHTKSNFLVNISIIFTYLFLTLFIISFCYKSFQILKMISVDVFELDKFLLNFFQLFLCSALCYICYCTIKIKNITKKELITYKVILLIKEYSYLYFFIIVAFIINDTFSTNTLEQKVEIFNIVFDMKSMLLLMSTIFIFIFADVYERAYILK